jgi:uncharacterized protein YbaR (Trm112 family)
MKLEKYQPGHVQFASNTLVFMAYCAITFTVMDTMLQAELLDILACPICKGGLIQDGLNSRILCKPCNRSYPVVDGIPILLPEHTDSELLTRCGTL